MRQSSRNILNMYDFKGNISMILQINIISHLHIIHIYASMYVIQAKIFLWKLFFFFILLTYRFDDDASIFGNLFYLQRRGAVAALRV